MQSSVLRQKLVSLTNGVDCAEDLVHEDGIQIVPCVVFLFFGIVFYSATMIYFIFFTIFWKYS